MKSLFTFAMNNHISARSDHRRLNEPRKSETNQDVENVATDRVGDGHVSVAWIFFLNNLKTNPKFDL